MEWLRQGIQRIKEVLGLTNKEVVHENHLDDRGTIKKHNINKDKKRESGILILFGLKMRPRKDFKTRNKDVAKSAEEILKIRKSQQRTFKSPVVRPVRVKKGSTWMQRILGSSSNSASSSDQDILDYFRVSAANDEEEPVWKTYASKFLNREHFNFVGSDKNLGPLVVSIKYPNIALTKSDNNLKETLNKKFSEKTLLILRLPSGLLKRSWNQFQLSNPTLKSPTELAKLSFPSLVCSSCGLLPVLCPDISKIIAEYDETCNIDEIENKSNEAKTEEIEEKLEPSGKTMKLKILQRKLITSTCKFLELSDWDLHAYEDFLIDKKSDLPKYMSFSLPLTFKTPKMCAKLVKKAKSPNFRSLPKKMLVFDDEAHVPPPTSGLEDCSDDDGSSEAIYLDNLVDDIKVPGGQMMKLRSVDVHTAEGDDLDLLMILKNLQLEKDEILKTNSMLKKEKEELYWNEKRLVRELATAHTIIDNLKKRLITT